MYSEAAGVPRATINRWLDRTRVKIRQTFTSFVSLFDYYRFIFFKEREKRGGCKQHKVDPLVMVIDAGLKGCTGREKGHR